MKLTRFRRHAILWKEGVDCPLPIAVQLIGPHLEDQTVLAFAAHLERKSDGFVPPPGYT